ncbi:MAG TPA: hypothetical protein VLA49_12310 [Anaerolineales bacterium]|nr:hypothetical protein [Anaerolineales bacterium]
MRKAISLLTLTALFLAACATLTGQESSPGEAPDQPRPEQTEVPLPPSGEVQDKPSQVELPEGAVLEFRRSGGFAGLNEVWTLYADGRLTRAESDQPGAATQEWQVEAEQVAVLLEVIDGLGFFSLPSGDLSQAPGADRFSYSLTVNYQGSSRTISAAEGAKGASAALWQVISEVQGFVDKVASSQDAS